MSRIARALFALLLIVTFLATPAAALRENGGGATAVSADESAGAPSAGVLGGLWNWLQSLFDEEHGTIVP